MKNKIKNRLIFASLFLPFVAVACWIMFLSVQRETGTEVKVAIAGYDPQDLLSGRYIQYTVDWARTDCSQFTDGKCPKDEFCKEKRWGRVCRFYVPEQDADKLDSLFRRRSSQEMVFEVVYSYHKGLEPLAKQLLINGEDWTKSIK